jgi:hypothetical protein
VPLESKRSNDSYGGLKNKGRAPKKQTVYTDIMNNPMAQGGQDKDTITNKQ